MFPDFWTINIPLQEKDKYLFRAILFINKNFPTAVS